MSFFLVKANTSTRVPRTAKKYSSAVFPSAFLRNVRARTSLESHLISVSSPRALTPPGASLEGQNLSPIPDMYLPVTFLVSSGSRVGTPKCRPVKFSHRLVRVYGSTSSSCSFAARCCGVCYVLVQLPPRKMTDTRTGLWSARVRRYRCIYCCTWHEACIFCRPVVQLGCPNLRYSVHAARGVFLVTYSRVTPKLFFFLGCPMTPP